MFVLTKTKTFANSLKRWSFLPDKPLISEDVVRARAYIKDYWPQLTRLHPGNDDTLLDLPNAYLVPAYEEAHEYDFNEMYYWDSYFMVQGMLDNEHKKLVTGILENLFAMFETYKIIPNASRTYLSGRSQPPFLTSFIWDVYYAYKLSDTWLAQAINLAKQEYQNVWMGTKKPNARMVHRGLSRYYDINYLNDLAEAESGWDMTPRFNRHALDYLPVDLNALLYKYEMDFAKADRHFGNLREAGQWETAARYRKKTMDELMWDGSRGLYYDYNYVKEKRSNISSLASYYPLWAGMVDNNQAQQLVKSLKRFENKGGLATTDSLSFGYHVLGGLPTQWAYPNGWAPLHFLVVKGLQRYNYSAEAKRIAMKWLKTNLSWFENHRVFLEKYNVVNPDKPPAKGLYPSQTGFGWTNAVFERFCQEFVDNSS